MCQLFQDNTMKPLKQIILFIISFLTLQSCQKNNDKIDLNFEKEFQDSIKKNNAEFFKYQYETYTSKILLCKF